MKRKIFHSLKIHVSVLLILINSTYSVTTLLAQEKTELKLDPLMFVALKESRNVTQKIGNQMFPGWQFSKIPVLFYRPNVQEILINFPHKPKGFKEYKGFNPLGNEKIYYRDDTTFFTIDGQNTRFEIDSITVLVVADRSSNQRSELKDIALNRPKAFAEKYFDDWGFIQSPYDDIALMLHESFHAYQFKKAPDKAANEGAIIRYSTLDPVNNALYVIEGNILRDALLAKDAATRLEKAKQFVAVKSYRQSLLDSTLSEYENLNEYSEGLAKYIEFAFARKAVNLIPGKEMSYFPKFNGYGSGLTKYLESKIDNMVNFVSVNSDAFENKFGTGPVRFKLYSLGACEGLLLDDLMPSWKEKIFDEKVYLISLLKQAVKLTPAESERYLKIAKETYNYNKAYSEKLQFQKDGEAYAKNKADKILNTDKTLIRISYGGFTERVGLYRFTPFGVTRISSSMAIYDLVPVLLGFKDGVELDAKQAYPVIIDKEKKQILFASGIPADQIKLIDGNKIDNNDFNLFGAPMEIKITGNIVDIKFK